MTLLNADKWLYGLLTTDAQLITALGGRVYAEVAPADTQYPLAVIQQVAANQVGNAYADRIMDNELWQVTIWHAATSYLSIEPIADRVRAVVHKASGTGVIGAVYEGSRRRAEDESGKSFRAILLEFRIFTQ